MSVDVICVTGSMASGTTTLATRLSKMFDWEPIFSEEHIHHSPFYDKFLQFPDRWAFQNQTHFLLDYVSSYSSIIKKSNKTTLCFDYMVREIIPYTEAMMMSGYISQEEYNLILSIFDKLSGHIAMPKLLIYIQADLTTIIRRIRFRHRLHESIINEAYLERLIYCFDKLLFNWKSCPILYVDSVKHNFRDDDVALALIASQVQSML